MMNSTDVLRQYKLGKHRYKHGLLVDDVMNTGFIKSTSVYSIAYDTACIYKWMLIV